MIINLKCAFVRHRELSGFLRDALRRAVAEKRVTPQFADAKLWAAEQLCAGRVRAMLEDTLDIIGAPRELPLDRIEARS